MTCPLSLYTDRNVESTETRLWLGERKMKNISSSSPREKLIYYQLPRDALGLISEIKGNGEVWFWFAEGKHPPRSVRAQGTI